MKQLIVMLFSVQLIWAAQRTEYGHGYQPELSISTQKCDEFIVQWPPVLQNDMRTIKAMQKDIMILPKVYAKYGNI